MARTRRDVLRLGAAAVALFPASVAGASNGVPEAVAVFTGGAEPVDGGLRLEVPEIADNGGAVPVRVAAPAGARRIALFADGNPRPGIAVFEFGRLVPVRGQDPHPARPEPDGDRGGGDGGRHVCPDLPEDRRDRRRLWVRGGRWRHRDRA